VSETFVRRKPLDQGRGEDPFYYILRTYLQYLQGLFNFMERGHFHWEPDLEKTEIVVTAEAPINMEVVGKRPAVAVILGPTQPANLAIDNMIDFNLTTNRRVRTDLYSGYLVPYCLADSETVAMRLAHIVSHYTRVHQRILESRGGFHQIARPAPTINAPSPPGALVQGDPQNLTMVQVNIPFHFQWTWATSPSRQAPQDRSLDMVTAMERAMDFPYSSPARLERVRLAMSTKPVLVRRITGGYAARPQTIEVGEEQVDFQESDLRPFGEGEESD